MMFVLFMGILLISSTFKPDRVQAATTVEIPWDKTPFLSTWNNQNITNNGKTLNCYYTPTSLTLTCDNNSNLTVAPTIYLKTASGTVFFTSQSYTLCSNSSQLSLYNSYFQQGWYLEYIYHTSNQYSWLCGTNVHINNFVCKITTNDTVPTFSGTDLALVYSQAPSSYANVNGAYGQSGKTNNYNKVPKTINFNIDYYNNCSWGDLAVAVAFKNASTGATILKLDHFYTTFDSTYKKTITVPYSILKNYESAFNCTWYAEVTWPSQGDNEGYIQGGDASLGLGFNSVNLSITYNDNPVIASSGNLPATKNTPNIC